MSNIKPVSDLRNYAPVLETVSEGSPVFLTKYGRGAYVIVDVKEFEELEKIREQFKRMTNGEKTSGLLKRCETVAAQSV